MPFTGLSSFSLKEEDYNNIGRAAFRWSEALG
jgi:hypothetical protein